MAGSWSLEASALGRTWVALSSLVSDEVAAQAEGSCGSLEDPTSVAGVELVSELSETVSPGAEDTVVVPLLSAESHGPEIRVFEHWGQSFKTFYKS